jgi:TetR/AcrR family transcriptional regulator of autoinduction and epiphytic fitness
VTSETQPPETDGRRLRRETNREAVVQALLELYRDGDLRPSAEEIAGRAGISARSLFRYFDDLDDLVRTAIGRQQQHLAPLFVLDVDAGLPFETRLDRFVAARIRLLEAMGEVGRLARSQAAVQPLVARELGRIRAELRTQVAEVFAVELRALPAADRNPALAAADVLSSWEGHDLLRNDQALSKAAAARTMARALRAVLGAPA